MNGKDMSLHIKTLPQEIEIVGDIAYIQLYDRVGKKKEKAIVDADMVDAVKKFTWFSSRKYVVSRLVPSNKFLRLHRLVMGCADSNYPYVDHINCDPLDNRRANLRMADYSQNAHNKKVAKQYRGVYFADTPSKGLKKKWRSFVHVNKQRVEIGRFESPEEAAWHYDQWASQLIGDFARLNYEYV